MTQRLLHYLLPIFLFFVAVSLRLFPLGNASVNFDQVQILTEANNIAHFDFTLIGPRTGPAAMFTGPLIYYVTAPLVFFFGDAAAISIAPVLISLLTGLALFFLTRYYLSHRTALFLTALWAFSPLLISLDKTFWNPNFTLLSSALIFIPLLHLDRHPRPTTFYLLLGSFLAYQAHFSGFLLVFLAAVWLIVRRRPRLLVPLCCGLFISLLPTLVFDLKNNFVNTNGLFALATDKTAWNLFSFGLDFFHNLVIILEMAGSLLIRGANTITSTILGLSIIISSWFILHKTHRSHLILIYFWLIATAFFFAFYSGDKPEYYFLLTFLPLLLLLVWCAQKIPLQPLFFASSFLLLHSFFINQPFLPSDNGFSLGRIIQISTLLKSQPVKEVIYDTKLGTDFGIKYFLSQTPLSVDGIPVHILYPSEAQYSGVHQFADVGVWFDDRRSDHNYLVKDDYLVAIAAGFDFYQSPDQKSDVVPYDEYSITQDNIIIGTLKIEPWNGLAGEEHNPWLDNCQTSLPPRTFCLTSPSLFWGYAELNEAAAIASASLDLNIR